MSGDFFSLGVVSVTPHSHSKRRGRPRPMPTAAVGAGPELPALQLQELAGPSALGDMKPPYPSSCHIRWACTWIKKSPRSLAFRERSRAKVHVGELRVWVISRGPWSDFLSRELTD